MDEKNKNFGDSLLNNLEQQRDEVSAGVQIESNEAQMAANYNQMMGNNVAQQQAEIAAGADIEAAMQGRKPISEAEAKALLMEETHKTEKKLEKAHKDNRKVMIIVIIVAVVLCAAGLIFALVMGSKNEENGKAENDLPVISAGEEAKEPDAPEDKIVALDVNDALVQRLYGNFVHVGGSYSSTLDFYTDKNVQNGDVSKTMMLDIALGNSGQRGKDCRAEHYVESGSESYEVGEVFGCRDGEEAREKIQETFGVAIELEDGDKTGEYCGAWMYDAQNDEFYVPSLGCGGSCLYGLTRELTGAEQDKNSIYLYETAYGGTCQSLAYVDGTLIAEVDDGEWMTDSDIDAYRDQLEKFKWTFTKNESGEYVFTGLERVK